MKGYRKGTSIAMLLNACKFTSHTSNNVTYEMKAYKLRHRHQMLCWQYTKPKSPHRCADDLILLCGTLLHRMDPRRQALALAIIPM